MHSRSLRDQPANPEVIALWLCCLMFIAGFWTGVLLIAEKFLQ